MIIISDIHGCYKTLLALLKKCPDEQVVFCGDLVDRGPDSASVVRFAMDNEIPTVKGNHEDLMLGHYGRNDHYDDGLWLMNGGGKALESFNLCVPDKVLDWAEKLPYFLKHEGLLVSHTGHGLIGNQPHGHLSALWHREPQFPQDDLFRVFGHTPEINPNITEQYAMIDTGCAYADRGYGKLTALQWPEMRIYQQENIDITP